MANIIIGTDLKNLVKIDRIGDYEMKDMDFTIYVIGTKSISFKKEQCIPQNNGRDGYKVCYNTADLGLGRVKIRVYANIVDDDFKDGKRTEIIDLDPKVNIIK